jgi:transcriptional regulator with PAS, ATPase and Fis domain
LHENHAQLIEKLYPGQDRPEVGIPTADSHFGSSGSQTIQDTEEIIEESLSLEEKEIELIKKALDKHRGKRKYAAEELGISERTLYRKIKEHNLE